MAKTKISEFSSTAADNTDITNINIAEGCSPANVNNSIRSLMALLKDQQTGTSGDPFTVSGTLTASGALTASGTLTSSGTLDVTGGFKLDGSAGTSGQVLVSAGSATPTWGNAFVAGMIIMWSGTIATIPTGWVLCNGSSGTPDLRNRFIIGAHSDDSGTAKTTVTGSATQTGGSKDAVVVSHTHTITDSGHVHTGVVSAGGSDLTGPNDRGLLNGTTASAVTGISINTAGVSGTNANLVPYYALAFIMKS
jgi:hypothetical protein